MSKGDIEFKDVAKLFIDYSCIGLSGGGVGKLIAGQKFFDVVLIPSKTTFLTCAGTTVASIVVAILVVEFVNNHMVDKGYKREGYIVLAGLGYFGVHQVTLWTGIHPFGFITLTLVGSLSGQLSHRLLKSWK